MFLYPAFFPKIIANQILNIFKIIQQPFNTYGIVIFMLDFNTAQLQGLISKR